MNARLPIPAATHASDRAFLRQLKIANRTQLKAMLATFERLAPDGPERDLSWKRAAVERRLGVQRNSFGWLEREVWVVVKRCP